MKNKMTVIVAALLIAAAGKGVIHAQESGWKFWGHLSTGFRFSAVEDSEWGAQAWQVQDKAPSTGFWNDADGASVRLDFNAAYSRDSYGLVFRTRIKPYELYRLFRNFSLVETDIYWNDQFNNRFNELFNNAYGWAEFADNKIRFSMGKMEDSEWPYSNGLGLRMTVRPVNGLSVGLMLNGSAAMRRLLDENKGYVKPNMMSDDEGWWGAFNFAEDMLRETSFGLNYSNSLFDIMAGVKLDSKGDSIEEWDAEGWETRRRWYSKLNDEEDAGMRAFGLFLLKAIPKVPIELVADGFNLTGFDKYGWVRLGQKFNFNGFVPRLNMEFYMEQMLFGREALWDSGWGITDYDSRFEHITVTNANGNRMNKLVYTDPIPRMYFRPGFSYEINNRWTAKLWLNCIVWPENYYSFEPHPWVGFRIGDRAHVEASYKLVFRQFDETFRKKANGNAPDTWVNHHVQLNVAWTY